MCAPAQCGNQRLLFLPLKEESVCASVTRQIKAPGKTSSVFNEQMLMVGKSHQVVGLPPQVLAGHEEQLEYIRISLIISLNREKPFPKAWTILIWTTSILLTPRPVVVGYTWSTFGPSRSLAPISAPPMSFLVNINRHTEIDVQKCKYVKKRRLPEDDTHSRVYCCVDTHVLLCKDSRVKLYMHLSFRLLYASWYKLQTLAEI